jgi:hypothetical protein
MVVEREIHGNLISDRKQELAQGCHIMRPNKIFSYKCCGYRSEGRCEDPDASASGDTSPTQCDATIISHCLVCRRKLVHSYPTWTRAIISLSMPLSGAILYVRFPIFSTFEDAPANIITIPTLDCGFTVIVLTIIICVANAGVYVAFAFACGIDIALTLTFTFAIAVALAIAIALALAVAVAVARTIRKLG